MASKISVILFLHMVWAVVLRNVTAHSSTVPLVSWTNIRNPDCPSDILSAPGDNILKFTSSDYLTCLKRYSPTKVLVFTLNDLDISDFNIHNQKNGRLAFGNLQEMLQETSIVMPSLSATAFLPHAVKSLKVTFPEAEVVVKELPVIDRENLHTLVDTISRIDDMIQEEISHINGPYVAVLTAESSPQFNDEHGASTIGRRLLATDEKDLSNNSTFINGTCIYINLGKASLDYGGDVPANLTFSKVTHTCGTNDSSVNITFDTDVEGGKTVLLSMSFVMHLYPVSLMSWWNVSSASVKHGLSGTEAEFELKDFSSYVAPSDWSWVCEAPQTLVYEPPKKDEGVFQRLTFSNIQMEAFISNSTKFSRGLDCSGFLTAPIWMGTMVALIMAIIFAFGLAMIAGLSTVDRFDDPRGKSIIVHSHETGN